jgi:diacylglycerol O-acyltransferase / wax synthase
MKRLSSVDAVLWFAEMHRFPMHGGGLCIWNPSETPNFCFAAVRDLLAARLPELPALRYRVAGSLLGLDRPWFVEDPTLDIDFHIRRITVPEPGGRRELEELVGHLMARPLDRARPLWEFWFIEGLQQGRVATLAKFHHALIDAGSGRGLTDVMYDTSPNPRPPAVADSHSVTEGRIPRFERRALAALFNVVMTPYRLVRVLGQMLVQQLAVRRLPNKPTHFFQAPTTRFNNTIGADRRVSSSRLEFDRLIAVKRAFGVKLNDVVVAVVSGALRTYLAERAELPERSLVAQMPISTRRDGTELGNQFTSMSIQLATDIEDPTARIKTIFNNTQGAKEVAQALSEHQSVALTETIPPGLLRLAIRAYTASHIGSHLAPINLVISNQFGSDYLLYLAGAVGEKVVPLGPLMLDVGLNISCFRYHKWIDFGFNTTPNIADDIDQLADAVEPAFEELEKAAGLS